VPGPLERHLGDFSPAQLSSLCRLSFEGFVVYGPDLPESKSVKPEYVLGAVAKHQDRMKFGL
jgi:hypothetical protein